MADRTSLANNKAIIRELENAIRDKNIPDSHKQQLEREINRLIEENIGIEAELYSERNKK